MTDRPPRPTTVLTGAEWQARLKEAAEAGIVLMPALEAACNGPGQVVLTALLLARSYCEQFSQLPPFEWYVARVAEVYAPPSEIRKKYEPS